MKPLSISETGSWLFVASRSFRNTITSVSSSAQKPFLIPSALRVKILALHLGRQEPAPAALSQVIYPVVLTCNLLPLPLPASPARTPHKPRAYLLCSWPYRTSKAAWHPGHLLRTEHMRVSGASGSCWLETWALGPAFSPCSQPPVTQSTRARIRKSERPDSVLFWSRLTLLSLPLLCKVHYVPYKCTN